MSIKEGKSYFISSGEKINNWAETTLDVKFDNHLAVAERLWLRKEIIRQDKLINS